MDSCGNSKAGSRGFLSYFRRTRPQRMQLLKSSTLDPFFNLAVEDWLLSPKSSRDRAKDGWQSLYLWRNEPCIVIGKYQNPWKECQLQEMEHSGVALVRRRTGGGAVYQDEGNSNFTFISPPSDYSVDRNFGIIVSALEDLGVAKGSAGKSGRNDLLVDGAKVSGSAFRLMKEGALHHGTMLRDVDLSALSKLLTPSLDKLESKGVKSVASRVRNLSELLPKSASSHSGFCTAMIEQFRRAYPNLAVAPSSGAEQEIMLIDHRLMNNNPELRSSYEHLKSWKWIYGRTPDFDHSLYRRFDWGSLDFQFNSKKGMIDECWIYSDCLYPALVEELRRTLSGSPINSGEIVGRLAKLKDTLPDVQQGMIDDISSWFKASFK